MIKLITHTEVKINDDIELNDIIYKMYLNGGVPDSIVNNLLLHGEMVWNSGHVITIYKIERSEDVKKSQS